MSAKKTSKKELAEQALATKELAAKKQSACNAALFLSDSRLNALLTVTKIHPEADSVELFKLCNQDTKEMLAGSTKKIETMLLHKLTP